MAKAFFVHEYRGNSFARYIANGFKTKETRTRRTLDKLCGPDPVYIIRTGRGRRPMIIGKCKLSGPAWYDVEKLHRPETIDETFVFSGRTLRRRNRRKMVIRRLRRGAVTVRRAGP